MPYPNEHAARVSNPKKFPKIRRENNKFGEGIDVIWGVKPDGKTEIQAIRFDKKKFTPAQAKKWLSDHNYSASLEEASDKAMDEEIKEVETEEADELETKMYGEEPMVEMAGPVSFAELEAMEEAREVEKELHEMTYQFGNLATNIMSRPDVEDKAKALSDLAAEYAGIVQDKMAMREEKGKSLWQRAKEVVKDALGIETKEPEPQKENKDLFIWKEDDTWRWIAAYSNNRRDDDNPPEIISSQSHKAFDEALNKGEYPMPELWMWHLNYPVGKALYHAYDADTGFPVAAGTFNKEMDWAAEGMLKAGWNGVSHGMPKDSIERDPADETVITRHVTREISILPNWAAANKLAFSLINKELDMADENKEVPAAKREEFIKAFGADRWAVIEAALADKSKQADEAGIEKKETEPAADPPPATEQEAPLTKADVNAMLAQFGAEVAKTVADLQMEVAALKEAKPAEKPPVAVSFLDMLKERSAIGKPENKIDGRSKEAKDGPEEEEASPTRSPVPLIDAIIKANHRGA